MPKQTFYRLRDEKQESILRAAIHEFVDKGFARATIEEIARKAGVAKGSMYQYFEDKKELYLYCAQWGLALFMGKLNDRIHVVDMDVFEYFKDNLARNQTIQEEKEIIVFLQYISREPDLAAPAMEALYKVGDVYGKKLIENSKRKGVVRTDIADELLLEFFFVVTDRFEKRWMGRYIDFTKETDRELPESMQAELEQMLMLLRNGMGG